MHCIEVQTKVNPGLRSLINFSGNLVRLISKKIRMYIIKNNAQQYKDELGK